MPNRTVNRLSRGDRRRNAKLRDLRSLVRPDLAILAVDLAEANQAAVVADHDSVVLGRRMFRCSAWGIDQILDWAIPIAQHAGFAGVVVACEPTWHRWKPVAERARARGLNMVCVQPLLVHRAREAEDFTRDRSDYKDATIIARLTSERRCYRPEVTTPTWARLGHLGQRRAAVPQAATAARQTLRDLLGVSWPSVLDPAAQPLDSLTFRACLAGATDPTRIVAMGDDAFAQAVAAELPRWGGTRRRHQIMRVVVAAAQAPGGVAAERVGAAERASFAVADWHRALQELGEVQGRMVAVLDQLHLTWLVTTITGLSAVGAAAILAETGDPARYDIARTWAKHAGLCPRDNTSGHLQGQTTTSGRGRPGLRTAAWRAIWALLPHNPVFAARSAHLTGRAHNPLNDGQARAALAAGLLRQLHAVCTRQVAWDPKIAAGEVTATAA